MRITISVIPLEQSPITAAIVIQRDYACQKLEVLGCSAEKNTNAVVVPICGENIEYIALKLIEDRLILVNVYRPSVLPAKDFLPVIIV